MFPYMIGQYTQDMYLACRTLLTHPPVASTLLAPICSTPLLSQMLPNPSSLMFDLRDLAKEVTIRCLVCACNPTKDAPGAELQAAKQCKIHKARSCHLPIPSVNTPTLRGPAPYLQHLTPTLLPLCPHCLVKD